jgi:hypothetical protein
MEEEKKKKKRGKACCLVVNITVAILDVIHNPVFYLKQHSGGWFLSASPGGPNRKSKSLYPDSSKNTNIKIPTQVYRSYVPSSCRS